MIRGLFSQQPPTPPRAGSVSSPVEASVAQASREATRGAMAADALVTKAAESSLENRIMYARVPARGLLEILSSGALPPDATSFHLDAFPDWRSRVLIMPLTDEGKKALLDQTPGLAESLAAGKDAWIEAKAPIPLGSHVQEILLDPEQKASVLKAYGELVAKGEAPETIAGKPFKTFFDQHVRATDDMFGEIELKNFRKHIPGFDQLPVLEQKARASLGGRLAETWPASIPGDVRRQMANTMIRHKAFNRPDPGAGLKAAGEIKEFFHGTTMGDMVGRIGFKGQPEMLFNELPKSVQGVLTRKFHVKFASILGPGVYYGNSSVASNYAMLKLMNNKPVQVVSGLVALGKTTMKDFVDEDTRISSVASPEGSYFVTKDPKRFSIKGVTTLDPKQTDGLMRYFPQIMKAHETDPLAVGYLVDRLPKGPSQRALEEALKTGDATTRRSATLLLARRGQEASVASTLKMLETEGAPEIKDSLLAAARSIGPGHAKRTAPIAEALMKSTPGGEEQTELVSRLSASLGEELKPLFERYGLKLEESVAPKGLMDRALSFASKGLKHRF